MGRLTYESHGGEYAPPGDYEDQAQLQENRGERKRGLLMAYDEFEADAVVDTRHTRGVREFAFIRFTDPDCRE